MLQSNEVTPDAALVVENVSATPTSTTSLISSFSPLTLAPENDIVALPKSTVQPAAVSCPPTLMSTPSVATLPVTFTPCAELAMLGISFCNLFQLPL